MFLGSFHKYIKRIFYDQTFPQINMITYMTVLVCGIKYNLKKKYSGVFSTTAKVFRLNFFFTSTNFQFQVNLSILFGFLFLLLMLCIFNTQECW